MNTVTGKGQHHSRCEVVISQDEISRRVGELGRQISREYQGENLTLICVLKGGVVFLADLIRHISIPLEIEFISAASYRKGATRDEDISINSNLSSSLKGRHLLLVEGIVDTGRTATIITKELKSLEPASISIAALLDKPGSHRTKVDIKYKGFTIGNEFVIGYGMDNTQQFRNLPYIGRFVEP